MNTLSISTQRGPAPEAGAAPTADNANIASYDVTDGISKIDLAALEVIRWTPAWMVRSERLLLYSLIFGLRPGRYLEIGTFHGGSALIAAAAMDAQGHDGRMFCIDPEPKIAPEHWERIKHRATVIKGRSPEVLARAYEAAGGAFDFVLIDGDHSRAGVLRDADGVLPYVAEGGYLLFHDGFNPDVAQGIDEFLRPHASVLGDMGLLTREVTYEQRPDSTAVRWGGLRMMVVRRGGREKLHKE